jgi:hypothetical protein
MPQAKDAQSLMEAHDDAVRKQGEEAILAKAHDLTNGNAGNPKLTGDVLYWLTGEQIEQGRLLRLLVQGQKHFRLHSECVLAHAGKSGKIALFGTTFKVPLAVAIGGFCFLKAIPHLDHMVTMLCIK